MELMTLEEIKRFAQVYVGVLGGEDFSTGLYINGGERIMVEYREKIYYATLVTMLIDNNKQLDEEMINICTYNLLKKSRKDENDCKFYEELSSRFNCNFNNKMDNFKFNKLCKTLQCDFKVNEKTNCQTTLNDFVK